ncbi:D-alanyl-D-alanine carboxypeptidase family protein [Fredinandcohnia sp. QZ13]|uniref:D-alanyl-D-alanine carboxypeptidase family protein n=1 Tax=Fredinandcohnia sp. QZ13 TaxID=3073144 RepID=UPI0028530B4D|nr:D-alanyl-D-alanine carboxypeptidase family protein [Fredinandcohnia sp. QZ13]MDR4889489.1 D-alanyl-D-alanine carboxypeptidase family protein [Fredinandcohnia sp. QZ13]
MKQFYFVFVLVFLMTSLSPFQVHAEGATKIGTPAIKSDAVILVDANTGSILYEKNSRTQMYPASLTKMATAIYAIEKGNLDDVVSVSANAYETDGTRVYLEEGEQVTLKHLIQGLLINSGNDAGVALAEHLNGDIKSFAKSLNQYLIEKIGVEQTHFTNPHGLFDENHYTTAYDLALITKYALKNPVFREIFGTKELAWDGESWDTTLFSHHLMLRGEIPYEGITGGKTGFVQESRYTLSTSAEQGDLSLIAIVLKAERDEDAYEDTVALLDYGFENFEISEVAANKKFYGEQNESYHLNKPLPYTQKKNENVQLAMNDQGVLQVLGDDGRQLAAKQLKMDMPKEAMGTRAEIDPDELSKKNHLPAILMLVFLSVGVVFLQKTIKNMKKKHLT